MAVIEIIGGCTGMSNLVEIWLKIYHKGQIRVNLLDVCCFYNRDRQINGNKFQLQLNNVT